jgi:hypothetical protein
MITARRLYELQEIELELERKQERLQQIEQSLSENDTLAQARASLAEVQKVVQELEQKQQALEREVEDIGGKTASKEEKLYGGSVRNPKELLGLQQEAEYFKTLRRQQENLLLNVMADLEMTRLEFAIRSEEVEEMEKEWHQERELLLKEQGQLRAESTTLEQKQKLALTRVDSASLELYRLLRRERQGIAVAKVEQGRCLGCRIILPMSHLQRPTGRGELMRCTNCGRILYFG